MSSTTKAPTPSNFYTLPSHLALTTESLRLNQQHLVFRLLLSALPSSPPSHSTLHITPLPSSSSSTQALRVLDLGTGTGIWAAEFALENPSASVLGVDLFPPSYSPKPANLEFRVLDAEGGDEEEWDRVVPPGEFDFIHTRMVLMTMKDPEKVVKRIWRALKPSGLVEFQEKQDPYRTDDPSEEAQNSPILLHSRLRTLAGQKLGLDRTIANKLPAWMEETGFVDVRAEEKRIPIGGWVTEPEELRIAGEKWRECLAWGTEGFCKQIFMEGLGWSEEEVKENVKGAVDDLGRGRVYGAMMFVRGRKPGGEERV